MTVLKPVGKVKSDFENPKDLVFACEKGLDTQTHSKIVINKEYVEGLEGLEEFSHIFIMYVLDKATKLELKTHPGPPSEKDLPSVGVFASRSQYRPNHIALRLVKLLKVERNTLHVQGLDAINNSKVIDVKPYVKGFDRPEEYECAGWYDWLEND